MRTARLVLLSWLLASSAAWSQGADTAETIAEGHRLASRLCSLCHLATPDQATLPLLHPPAPPFATIVRRSDLTADWLTNFLKTTHRGLDEPNGMPNPELADYQTRQIVAYLMSLHQQQQSAPGGKKSISGSPPRQQALIMHKPNSDRARR